MITVKKIIKRILKGKYSELEANILITKHYKNEYFDSFYSEFKSRTTLILMEFIFELSDAEILRIIEDVNEFNEKNNFNSKIDIPKIYVSYQDEWDKIKVLYKKIDKYEFIFNVQGLDEKPSKTNYYKSLIFLNKLITNYITHNNFRYGFGYSIEKLNKLQYYPVLLDLIKTLETPPPKESDAKHTEAIKKQFTFVNHFDFVDSNEVYSYFYEKLVSKRMLDEKDLQEYLIQAFQETTPPKKLFRLKNITAKEKVYNVFYHYFKSIAQKPHGKQREYVDLLGKYFKGFNSDTIVSNWSKGYKPKNYK